MDIGDIRFREAQGELRKTSGELEEDREHAGGERVEQTGMAHPVRTGQTAEAVDDGERGFPGAFVYV